MEGLHRDVHPFLLQQDVERSHNIQRNETSSRLSESQFLLYQNVIDEIKLRSIQKKKAYLVKQQSNDGEAIRLRGGCTNTPSATNEPPIQHPHQTAQQLSNNTNNNNRFFTELTTRSTLKEEVEAEEQVAERRSTQRRNNKKRKIVPRALEESQVVRLVPGRHQPKELFHKWLHDRKIDWAVSLCLVM